MVPRSDLFYLKMRTFLAAVGIGTQVLGHPVCNRVSVSVFSTSQAGERVRGKKRKLSDDKMSDRTTECTFTFHLRFSRKIFPAEYATFTRLGVRLPCDVSGNSGYAYVLIKSSQIRTKWSSLSAGVDNLNV